MKAIVINTATPLTYEFKELHDDNLMHELQEVVDGWVELVRPKDLDAPFVFVCDECGTLKEKPKINYVPSIVYGGFIYGNVAFLIEEFGKTGEPELRGMTDEEANELLSYFKLVGMDITEAENNA